MYACPLTRLNGEVSFETAAALDMLSAAGPVSAAAAATHSRHASAETPQPAHDVRVRKPRHPPIVP